MNEDKDRIVEVIALGKEPKKISVNKDEKVGEVLEKAGISSDNVMADGESIDVSESIGDVKVLNAIPRVKGGL